jgi:predicted metal-dependent HD superfamily phosphohydrolase
VQHVQNLILVTRHQHVPHHSDEKFVVDIDLSGLGYPWLIFREDSQAVREEFAGISDEAFYPSHMQFLRLLLERPALYATDFFRGLYEISARQNLKQYLQELSEKGFRSA